MSTVRTSIFYTPHADDETLAMAGAILRAKLEGQRVVLVLVTDNAPSRRATDLFSDRLRCHWHERRKHDLSRMDIPAARLLEFSDAATRLGADELAVLGIPERIAVEDYPRFVESIGITISRYTTMYPDAMHHFVCGAADRHAINAVANLSHVACEAAALRAIHDPARRRFHRVYVYSQPIAQRRADQIDVLSPEIMERKRDALDAYRVWAPDDGRLAFGYHSVPELFDAAADDPHEYVDLVAA